MPDERDAEGDLADADQAQDDRCHIGRKSGAGQNGQLAAVGDKQLRDEALVPPDSGEGDAGKGVEEAALQRDGGVKAYATLPNKTKKDRYNSKPARPFESKKKRPQSFARAALYKFTKCARINRTMPAPIASLRIPNTS